MQSAQYCVIDCLRAIEDKFPEWVSGWGWMAGGNTILQPVRTLYTIIIEPCAKYYAHAHRKWITITGPHRILSSRDALRMLSDYKKASMRNTI